MTTPTLNQDFFEKWIAELRDESIPQARSALGDRDRGYCCLGVMMRVMPEVEVIPSTRAYNLTRYQRPGSEADASSTGLFPYAWEQLFDMKGQRSRDADLYLDYPFELRPLQDDDPDSAEQDLSAMFMNDTLGLTFPQIADMFEYFGPKSPETYEPV